MGPIDPFLKRICGAIGFSCYAALKEIKEEDLAEIYKELEEIVKNAETDLKEDLQALSPRFDPASFGLKFAQKSTLKAVLKVVVAAASHEDFQLKTSEPKNLKLETAFKEEHNLKARHILSKLFLENKLRLLARSLPTLQNVVFNVNKI